MRACVDGFKAPEAAANVDELVGTASYAGLLDIMDDG